MKYDQAVQLNGADFRRKTGVDPETFAEMEAVLHDCEANIGKSGRPPALPVGARLLLTLEFWREYRTCFHLAQDWGVHETTVLRTVVRVEDALLHSGRFSLPGKRTLTNAGTEFTAVVVDVSEVPCERPKKLRRSIGIEELILEPLKKGHRIASEAQLLASGFMTDIEFGTEDSPRRHAGGPKLRWGRGPHACPERRDQTHLTPNHRAKGSSFPTRNASLVIPGGAKELLQIIVRPGQTWKAVRREEVRSVTPTDFQEVLEWR